MNARYSPAHLVALLFVTSEIPAIAFAQATHGSTDPEEIVIIGTPRRASADEMAQPVSVLRGEALERALSLNLGETLAGQVGVNSSYFGAGAARPCRNGRMR